MAIQISISVKNLDQILNAFKAFPNETAVALREASTKSAFKVEREAKLVTPVDTGRLRSSIATSLGILNKGITSVVSTNVNYAGWVHDGTRRMKSRPYMKIGADASLSYITSQYVAAIEKVVGHLAK